MGTTDFAVPSLKILVDAGYNIVGVITAPDRKSGRGQKLRSSPVKVYAESQGLKVLQPTNLKSEKFNEELKSLNANLQVVVAFRMLPEIVWSYPEYGTFNLHGSLLPQYRGAAPIHWAVINGEKETGVTTFFLKHEIDTGDLILQKRICIEKRDNTGIVHDRLMSIGAEAVLETVQLIEKNSVVAQPQEVSDELKHAPKIFKEDTYINWQQSGETIYNFIRGMNPFPGAISKFGDSMMKIYESEFETTIHNESIGSIQTDNKKYIMVAVKDGWIKLLSIQLAGKKRVDIEDFLRGNQIDEQLIFS